MVRAPEPSFNDRCARERTCCTPQSRHRGGANRSLEVGRGNSVRRAKSGEPVGFAAFPAAVLRTRIVRCRAVVIDRLNCAAVASQWRLGCDERLNAPVTDLLDKDDHLGPGLPHPGRRRRADRRSNPWGRGRRTRSLGPRKQSVVSSSSRAIAATTSAVSLHASWRGATRCRSSPGRRAARRERRMMSSGRHDRDGTILSVDMES